MSPVLWIALLNHSAPRLELLLTLGHHTVSPAGRGLHLSASHYRFPARPVGRGESWNSELRAARDSRASRYNIRARVEPLRKCGTSIRLAH